jgi:hypothetical protein
LRRSCAIVHVLLRSGFALSVYIIIEDVKKLIYRFEKTELVLNIFFFFKNLGVDYEFYYDFISALFFLVVLFLTE